MHISAEDFIRAWQGSPLTVRELAKQLGLTYSACVTRAAKYRNMGIPLKMRGSTEPLDRKRLTEVAKEALWNGTPNGSGADGTRASERDI